jgi:hypothetical protein
VSTTTGIGRSIGGEAVEVTKEEGEARMGSDGMETLGSRKSSTRTVRIDSNRPWLPCINAAVAADAVRSGELEADLWEELEGSATC